MSAPATSSNDEQEQKVQPPPPTKVPTRSSDDHEEEKEDLSKGPAVNQAEVSDAAKGSPRPAPQEPFPVGKVKFVLIFLSLMLCIFLFALDQLIVATAIPKITNQFNSLKEISWLANGFFLTLLSFNLAFAQWMQIFPAKHVALFAIGVFELGSLLCGVAPSMPVLILGRAIAGVGGTGIFNSMLMILTELTTVTERAKLFGLMGVNFAIASVVGPLVGGAFADKITWRWCFYINLPIGGFAFVLLFFLTETHHPYGRAATYKGYGWHMFSQLAQCDWLGIALVLGWGVCFILALEYGGVERPWNDGGVIAMLVLIGVLPVIFIAWEVYMGPKGLLPLRYFKRRNIVGAALIACFTFAPFTFGIYYLALQYQAVYNRSATAAGILLLPLIIVQVIVIIGSGRVVAATGRPWPVLVVGCTFITIACGLLYSVSPTDSKSYPMGYSALLGIGIGCVLQNAIVCAQFDLQKEPHLIAVGTGVITFMGFIGRLLGISLGGSVFANMLKVYLYKDIPGISPTLVNYVQSSADAVWHTVPDTIRPQVVGAYVKALDDVYIIGVPCGAIALFSAAFIVKSGRMIQAPPKPSAAVAASEGKDLQEAEKEVEKKNDEARLADAEAAVAAAA